MGRQSFSGKSILIVGGTSGVGFAIAEACVELGARVVVVSRSQDKVNMAVERLKRSYEDAIQRVQGYVCDLAGGEVEAELAKLFEVITDKGSNLIDHVVSTAGSHPNTMTLGEATLENMVSASRHLFIGDVLLAKLALKHLRPADTSSFTMTGGAGTQKPPHGWSLWAGIGGAKDSLTRGLAVSMKPIRVNLVSLGAIQTELFDEAGGKWGQETLEKAAKTASLLGTIGKPEDVAETYLALMKNKFVTGTISMVEGGALLN
ncbi:unnamed protein product [Clonostachys rhizophaga]|uniref:Uncharacterized protein n=1 Tax=Clonostachys rhizophaga TaxID=160324 RepID=A0A9N9VDF3_9HYPO|nr:unnamed protein product [Clonostachys rhizophaga]